MLFSSPITRQQVPISEPFGDYHVFREPYTGVQFTDQWLETTQERTRLLSQYDITPISIGLMQVFEGDAYRSYLYIAFVATLRSFNPEPNNNCSPAMLQHPYYFRIPAGEYLCAAVPERPEIIVEFEMGTMDYHCFPPKLEQRILLRRDHT